MPDNAGIDELDEIEQILTFLRKYIAEHRAKKLLCIFVRLETIEILRVVARPAVSTWPELGTTGNLKWTFNGYHMEKTVPFSCALTEAQRSKLNSGLEKEFVAVWAKHNKIVTQEELDELLAEACVQATETDYRPAEGLPEDYYAG